MKNSRRKEIALVASGIILGASIAAPTAGAALMAQQSSQKDHGGRQAGAD